MRKIKKEEILNKIQKETNYEDKKFMASHFLYVWFEHIFDSPNLLKRVENNLQTFSSVYYNEEINLLKLKAEILGALIEYGLTDLKQYKGFFDLIIEDLFDERLPIMFIINLKNILKQVVFNILFSKKILEEKLEEDFYRCFLLNEKNKMEKAPIYQYDKMLDETCFSLENLKVVPNEPFNKDLRYLLKPRYSINLDTKILFIYSLNSNNEGKLSSLIGFDQTIKQGKFPELKNHKLVIFDYPALLSASYLIEVDYTQGKTHEEILADYFARRSRNNPKEIYVIRNVDDVFTIDRNPIATNSEIYLSNLQVRGRVSFIQHLILNNNFREKMLPIIILKNIDSSFSDNIIVNKEDSNIFFYEFKKYNRKMLIKIFKDHGNYDMSIIKNILNIVFKNEKAFTIRTSMFKMVREAYISLERIHGKKIDDEKILDYFYSVYKIKLKTNEKIGDEKRFLEETKKEIKGQEVALTKISKLLRESEILKILDKNKPFNTLLFIGTPGTGKTETCKLIAKNYLGDETAFVHLNGGEYQKEGSLNKITGSEPGYLGYGQKSHLVSKLLENQRLVIVFDELERFHSSIITFLYGLLDEGEFRSGDNKLLSVRDCIIVFTSNLGTDNSNNGYEAFRSKTINEEQTIQEVIDYLPQAIVSRINKNRIVYYKQLSEQTAEEIIDNLLSKYNKAVGEEKAIVLTNEEKEQIINESGLDLYGARDIRQKLVELLDNKILEKEEGER